MKNHETINKDELTYPQIEELSTVTDFAGADSVIMSILKDYGEVLTKLKLTSEIHRRGDIKEKSDLD